MKFKNIAITLSVATVLGVGMIGTVTAKASDDFQTLAVNEENTSDDNYLEGYWCENNSNMNLTEEQKQLFDKGYNELTGEEKIFFDQYHGKSKRNLSEEELNRYYEIHDKAFKYLGTEFSDACNRRRENMMERRGSCGNGQGNRGFQGRGNGINK